MAARIVQVPQDKADLNERREAVQADKERPIPDERKKRGVSGVVGEGGRDVF
jgi:hypothetical protein